MQRGGFGIVLVGASTQGHTALIPHGESAQIHVPGQVRFLSEAPRYLLISQREDGHDNPMRMVQEENGRKAATL